MSVIPFFQVKIYVSEFVSVCCVCNEKGLEHAPNCLYQWLDFHSGDNRRDYISQKCGKIMDDYYFHFFLFFIFQIKNVKRKNF